MLSILYSTNLKLNFQSHKFIEYFLLNKKLFFYKSLFFDVLE